MTTLTRTNSRANPLYKDYVNFLASYKNGKKDEDADSVGPVKSFSLTSSSNTSSSSLSSDATDFSKSSSSSYSAYLETTKAKKFESVRPHFEEKEKTEEKTVKKSEIVIEIQPAKSVSEVSKMFESKEKKAPPKNAKINSTISIFEKQIKKENKPKISEKPNFLPKIDAPQSPPLILQSPVPSPVPEAVVPSPPPLPPVESAPTPPPMPTFLNSQKPAQIDTNKQVNGTMKVQATLTKGPQIKYSVNSQNGVPVDRNDPLVNKLVYGTLRGLYGAYHDKATDMLANMPKNMVTRSNGVQSRIEQIAANGGLEKLNGRVNPKVEE